MPLTDLDREAIRALIPIQPMSFRPEWSSNGKIYVQYGNYENLYLAVWTHRRQLRSDFRERLLLRACGVLGLEYGMLVDLIETCDA